MFRRFLLVGMIALLGIGVSFADFQSEWNDCSKLLNASTCYEKVQKKYIVTKAKACTYKDDTITNKPLQTSRPQEKTLTTSFYKYNNKLFYQVAVSKDKKFTADKVKSYLYMYNCKTKKSYDMSKNLPESFLHVGDIISADDEVIRLAQPIQFNKGKIFFQRELGGLAGPGYFLYDTVKSVFTELKIEKFKNYKVWAEKIIQSLPEGVGVSMPIISSVNKDFVGTVSFAGQTAKINLLTKLIHYVSGSVTTTKSNIQNTKDIVGTTIPKGEDIERFLSYYLSEEGLTGKVIGKKLARKDIITVSMGDKSVNGKCADYMSTECINFIIKNNIIIWSNSKPFIDSKKKCEQELKTIGSCVGYPGDGEVYRFTDKGVLFRFSGGEGAACQGGGADRFTYVNFDDMKTFYSVLSWQDTGISPDPQDDMCENKNTKRTKTEILRFYKSNNDWNDEKKALPIIAKTTEEAFYKYYNIPQSKD